MPSVSDRVKGASIPTPRIKDAKELRDLVRFWVGRIAYERIMADIPPEQVFGEAINDGVLDKDLGQEFLISVSYKMFKWPGKPLVERLAEWYRSCGGIWADVRSSTGIALIERIGALVRESEADFSTYQRQTNYAWARKCLKSR